MNTEPDLDMAAEHIADSAFWEADSTHRHAVFSFLRNEAPVRWFPPRTSKFQRTCSGFWALTRYDDIWNAARTPRVFCSRFGIDIEEKPAELPEAPTMINMDDPEHFRMRRIVSAGFTPKRIATIDAQLRVTASQIVDAAIEQFGDGTEFDLVEHISSRLPLHAICELMGVPAADRDQLFTWTNATASLDDPTVGIAVAVEAIDALTDYATSLGRLRREHPVDDLTSVLMGAHIDGERLTSTDYANFFSLLVGAGNETTRNAISHGVLLLTVHPEQRSVWFSAFDDHVATAVEEIVRYETPITHMCRVLTQDVTIRGVELAAGQKVALWYTSANRDGDAFEHPDDFDIRRPVSPQHTAFGGGGPHFCLGASLARREIAVMFEEIHRRIPTLHVTGEPERVLSMSLNSIRSMPARLF